MVLTVTCQQTLAKLSTAPKWLSARVPFFRGRSTLVSSAYCSTIRSYSRSRLGLNRYPAGRLNEAPSVGLSASLNSAGFKLGRLQTGTPARLDGKTIDFSNLSPQEGDAEPLPFSFLNRTVDNAVRWLPQISCNRLPLN